MIPNQGVQQFKQIVDTMCEKSTDVFRAKKSALEQGDEVLLHQVGEDTDIMSILCSQKRSSDDVRFVNCTGILSVHEAEWVCLYRSLTFAAMDTTSNALSRILHVLAQHPDVQAKLRNEIMDACHETDLSYDKLIELPYLGCGLSRNVASVGLRSEVERYPG
ncbi:hypothetical protein A0H81_12309 [Grifola frondosa]|uniref:Cytochrome P450 n=1 Tax=Grifola frondosa TaxID=5627 RepID=A0A1C7LTD0_GRIFR|nr:hypothetical protein A0H81_12309 [Grifola frondosa]